MTPRVRKILAIVLIIAIIALVGIATYFLFFNKKDNALHVRRISVQEFVDHRLAEYSDSRLYLHPYGAFEIELIRTIGEESEVYFVGNGTYTKTRNAYTFTYADSYSRTGSHLEQRKNFTESYIIESNGRVRFDTSWGISYYFGK